MADPRLAHVLRSGDRVRALQPVEVGLGSLPSCSKVPAGTEGVVIDDLNEQVDRERKAETWRRDPLPPPSTSKDLACVRFGSLGQGWCRYAEVEKIAWTDEQLEALWAELGNVPFNEGKDDQVLADRWHHFRKGTDRHTIWQWFDQQHSKGVHFLMYGYVPDPR